MSTVYDFSVARLNGESVSLGDYKGKVLLIVNVASKCGFTPQYEGLEALYQANKDKGFEILGFPCNQFLAQEPGTAGEISSFCKLTYGVDFPMFAKVDVRGENTAPLYQYLTKTAPFGGFDFKYEGAKVIEGVLKEHYPEILTTDDIKWNFTKFLIGRDGAVLGRFESYIEPKEIQPAIDKAL